LYQGIFGIERVETWSYLCEKIASTYNGNNKLSYVHFIEPRRDRIEVDKSGFRESWGLPNISNEPFRSILSKSSIPCISCGGWDGSNLADAVQAGWDAVVFARWFVSNPDLPERLRLGRALHDFDRSRFYGSWDGIRENGYVYYPTWAEEEAVVP
jgi:2,4-dienoyl-CoA reductase-like NADH-dependent reductase (Old Yellow Enzyme family)